MAQAVLAAFAAGWSTRVMGRPERWRFRWYWGCATEDGTIVACKHRTASLFPTEA